MNKKKIVENLPWIVIGFFVLLPLLEIGLGDFIFLALIVFLFFSYIKKINFNRLFRTENKNMSNTIDVDQLKELKNLKKIIAGAVLVILLGWLFFSSIVIVEAGEIGVYSLFGKVNEKEKSSGFHLVIPLARVTKMSVRTQEYTMSGAQGEGQVTGPDAITALTKEGLKVDLDITILYHLEEDKASDIYEKVGTDYDKKIIRPAIRSTIRKIIAQYDAKVIYSEKRKEAAERIMSELKTKLEPRGVILEDVLLRNVKLPGKLANSIEEKLQAEQEAKKMDFVLERERKEKERKIIEAEGQKESQRIINESLTPTYLDYLYIKNLENREGTIYVPISGESGMPLYKNVGQ